MGNINVHLDDNYFNKFKELKVFLECKTNEEAVEKIILLAQTHIQQINQPRPLALSGNGVKQPRPRTASSNGSTQENG